MIPKWQMAALAILVGAAIAMAIHGSPNSYAYVFLTGQCNRQPAPAACHPAPLRRPGRIWHITP